MSSFNSILYPLILNNKQLFDFKSEYAIDGGWILMGDLDQEVYIDKKLSNLLGVKTAHIALEKIIKEETAQELIKLFNESSEKLAHSSQTQEIFHKSGTSVLQHIKFFVGVDEQNNKYLIGGHQHIYSENKLIEGKSTYDNIIEGTNLGTWEWNIQTGETRFNERWAEIIGYSLAEIEPTTIETWSKFAHPDDLKESEAALQSHFEGNSYRYEFESRMKHKDGHWVWVLDRGKVFTWTEDGEPEWMVGSHQEITKQKKEQLASIKFRELFSRITEAASIGVWEVDFIDNTTTWGTMTAKIHEVPKGYQPTLENAIEFIPAGVNRDILMEHYTKAIENNVAYDIEVQILTYTNKLKWVRSIGFPEFENGKCKRLYGLFQDIDRIKRNQLRNNKVITATQEQNSRLVNFAHIVSHNLRSHSNNFGMLVGMLDKELEKDRRQRVHEMLLSASNKLKETIEHLDEVVDINLSLEERFTNLQLNKYILASINSLSATVESSDFEINLNLDKEYFVFGVPAYLESLTLNFLSNSIKYADPTKDRQFVNVSAEQVGSEVLLHFADNGLGINLEKHGEKLFGMYRTFHRNKDAKGIGLFITRNQVEAMGGRISVDSKIGVGTTFTVHLRAKEGEFTTP